MSEGEGRVILDLCGGTGAWSRPYADAGYDVRVVTLPEQDVRDYRYAGKVHGVLVAPPCTEYAVSGARWWAGKAPELLAGANEIVHTCLSIIRETRPEWWALENPVGRLARCVPELGRWRYTFQPWEYGDPEVKRTCMWGDHVQPVRTPVFGDYAARVHRMAPSPERATLRSITPLGFARAFFAANP